MTDVAYVGLLLVFVALGLFVYALAVGSKVAGAIGASLVVLMFATVVGFRVGARRRAESNDSGIPIEGANVWARPLRREQIDRYLLTYRGVPSDPQRTVSVLREPKNSVDRRAA
nr:hypothetical protein [Mycobacterium sp. IDR2000157661]